MHSFILLKSLLNAVHVMQSSAITWVQFTLFKIDGLQVRLSVVQQAERISLLVSTIPYSFIIHNGGLDEIC